MKINKLSHDLPLTMLQPCWKKAMLKPLGWELYPWLNHCCIPNLLLKEIFFNLQSTIKTNRIVIDPLKGRHRRLIFSIPPNCIFNWRRAHMLLTIQLVSWMALNFLLQLDTRGRIWCCDLLLQRSAVSHFAQEDSYAIMPLQKLFCKF